MTTTPFTIAGGWSFGSLILHVLTPFAALYAGKTWAMHIQTYGPPDYLMYGTHEHPEAGHQMGGWNPYDDGQPYGDGGDDHGDEGEDEWESDPEAHEHYGPPPPPQGGYRAPPTGKKGRRI